jgi:hypothetical protein
MSGRSTPSAFKRAFIGDDAGQASKVPAEDLFHVAGRFGPIFRVRSTDDADTVLFADGSTFDVRMFGAVGDGVTDDTAAFQAAVAAIPAGGGEYVIPSGRYLLSDTINIPSNVLVRGNGRGNTVLLASATWPTNSGRYSFFENENYDAGTIIDHNITIRDLTLDYYEFGSAPPGGGKHAIRMWFARGITISGVEFQCSTTGFSAEDAVACRACEDVLLSGCYAYGAVNCTWDFWEECRNVALSGLYAESAQIEQHVNFNPERTGGPNVGRVAEGFTMTGCHFRYSGATAAPILLSPLVGANYVREVVVTGNILENTYIVIRGGVTNAVVSGNTIKGVKGGLSAIESYTNLGDAPANIVVTGNAISDPETVVGNLGVIRIQCDSAVVSGNAVHGSTYGVVPGIYCGSSTVILGTNYVSNGVVTASAGTINSSASRVGNNKQLGFFDTAGSVAHIILQTDNNLVFNGTSASGGLRPFMTIFQRSSVSELILPLSTLLSGTYRTVPVTGIAAAGTNIGGATVLTGNVNVVETCTAGVADGVALVAVNGREQTVINTTADTLKVYPNNSGSAQIDVGGIGVPTTIAAGKSKTFVQVVLNDFRTIAAT